MRTAVLFSTLIGLTTAAPTRADEPAAEPVPPPPAAAALGSPAEELGYALGYRIGSRIIADHRALGTPLDAAALAAGAIRAGLGPHVLRVETAAISLAARLA